MTLEQYANWLSDSAPKYFVAGTLWNTRVIVARDCILSVRETTSPRGEKGLLIVFGNPGGGSDDYQKAFIPANQGGAWR